MTKAVTLLSDETLRDWSEKVMEEESLVSRLLRLCITLNAKLDGLLLLKLLGEEFSAGYQFGGLFDDEITDSVFEFTHHISGNRFISIHKISSY